MINLQLTPTTTEPLISLNFRAVATLCETRLLALVALRHCLRIGLS